MEVFKQRKDEKDAGNHESEILLELYDNWWGPEKERGRDWNRFEHYDVCAWRMLLKFKLMILKALNAVLRMRFLTEFLKVEELRRLRFEWKELVIFDDWKIS